MATFVLMHGGWHGGWCWRRVAKLLRARGHEVLTPTQTGLGERAHLLRTDLTTETFVQDLVGVLEAEELVDAVLVGHSSGGVTITGAADRVPERVRSLIYLDGILLQDGESLADQFSPPQAAAYEAAVAAGGVNFPPPPAAAFDVPAGPDAEWVNRRMTAQPFGTAKSALRLAHPLGNGLPCAYIACTAPAHPFVAASHAWVKGREGWRWQEIATGHDAMVTAPEAVADLLEELA